MNEKIRLTDEQLKRSKALIEALRSGKYKQATSRLRRSEKHFCATGVACEVYRLESGNGAWVQPFGALYFFQIGKTKPDAQSWACDVPPQQVVDYFGKYINSLIDWNDNEELTFDEIAKRIEQQFNPKKWWQIWIR